MKLCGHYILSQLFKLHSLPPPPPPFSSLSLFFPSCTSSEAYRGALSQEELDELDRKAALKTEAMMNILSREEDLRNIRDSQVVMDKVRWRIWEHVYWIQLWTMQYTWGREALCSCVPLTVGEFTIDIVWEEASMERSLPIIATSPTHSNQVFRIWWFRSWYLWAHFYTNWTL